MDLANLENGYSNRVKFNPNERMVLTCLGHVI